MAGVYHFPIKKVLAKFAETYLEGRHFKTFDDLEAVLMAWPKYARQEEIDIGALNGFYSRIWVTYSGTLVVTGVGAINPLPVARIK